MTKRGEGSSDNDYCGARKSHTASSIAIGCVPGDSRGVLYNFLLLLSCATRRWWQEGSRMACFVVAVVPDSVAVVVCRSRASGLVLVRNWQMTLCCSVLDVLLIAADCWLIISSSDFLFFFWHTSTFQLLDIQAMVTGVVLPSPPPFIAFIFFWRILFSTHWSSIFHRVLLTHALALSASRLVHKTTNYTNKHSEGFEVTKLTHTRLVDITWYGTGAVSDIEPVAPVG